MQACVSFDTYIYRTNQAEVQTAARFAHLVGEQAGILNRQHPSIFICFIHMAVPPPRGRGEGAPRLPGGVDRVNQLAILVNAASHGCVHTCKQQKLLVQNADIVGKLELRQECFTLALYWKCWRWLRQYYAIRECRCVHNTAWLFVH